MIGSSKEPLNHQGAKTSGATRRGWSGSSRRDGRELACGGWRREGTQRSQRSPKAAVKRDDASDGVIATPNPRRSWGPLLRAGPDANASVELSVNVTAEEQSSGPRPIRKTVSGVGIPAGLAEYGARCAPRTQAPSACPRCWTFRVAGLPGHASVRVIVRCRRCRRSAGRGTPVQYGWRLAIGSAGCEQGQRGEEDRDLHAALTPDLQVVGQSSRRSPHWPGNRSRRRSPRAVSGAGRCDGGLSVGALRCRRRSDSIEK